MSTFYRVGDVLDIDSENGIWLDYNDYTWFFFIKDDVWTEEECRNAKTKGVTVSFMQKGIVDGFLISINDVVEVSDVPLCLWDATKDLFNSFKDSQLYNCKVILLDKMNTIKVIREGTFTKEVSFGIKKALQNQKLSGYDERSYSAAYTKLTKKYEPYEEEQFVLFKQQF